MFKKLESLGEDYYYMLMQPPKERVTLSKLKSTSWVLVFVALSLGALIPVTMLYSALDAQMVPGYFHITTYVMVAYAFLYLLFVLVTNFGQVLIHHYRLQLIARFAGVLTLQLSFWNFFMSVTYAMNNGAVEYFLLFVYILLAAVGINIWVIWRTAKQITGGAYRKGGGGFFGILDKPKVKKLVERLKEHTPLIGLFPSIVSLFLIIVKEVYATNPQNARPVVLPTIFAITVFLFLVLGTMSTYSLFVKLHLYKKFGYQDDYLITKEKKKDKHAL